MEFKNLLKFFFISFSIFNFSLSNEINNSKKNIVICDEYINFLQKIGSSNEKISSKDLEIYFAKDCKKFINGSCVVKNIQEMANQLQEAKNVFGLWQINLNNDNKTNSDHVIKYYISSKLGTYIVMASITLDDDGLIKEFYEVYSQVNKVFLSKYKETQHCKVNCVEHDKEIADLILKNIEEAFPTICSNFNVDYNKKIEINIYPNIESFHAELNKQLASWAVSYCNGDKNSFSIVSPSNPGKYHTYNSIMNLIFANVVRLVCYDIHKGKISRWLRDGIAFYYTRYSSSKNFDSFFYKDLPSLDQLDTNDSEEFSRLNGPHLSYTLVEFLNNEWGWPIILRILADYNNFEKIIGISKDEFELKWKNYLNKSY